MKELKILKRSFTFEIDKFESDGIESSNATLLYLQSSLLDDAIKELEKEDEGNKEEKENREIILSQTRISDSDSTSSICPSAFYHQFSPIVMPTFYDNDSKRELILSNVEKLFIANGNEPLSASTILTHLINNCRITVHGKKPINTLASYLRGGDKFTRSLDKKWSLA